MSCNKCPVEEVLGKTKSKKSHKKHQEENCCIPECNPDCCTPAFQRLDKLRGQWALINIAGTLPDTGAYNRSGSVIADPTTSTGILYNNPLPSGVTTAPVNLITGNNAIWAYYFVNVVRYLNFEACGKLDQVVGWSVNVSTGDLLLYQNIDELQLTTSTSRANLLSYSEENRSSIVKNQLKNIEPFYRLSLKAIDRVSQNPKEEGNICEIHDKCAGSWLVAINRADGTASVCDYTGVYTIVAVKLC
jgi:hypothetical protein